MVDRCILLLTERRSVSINVLCIYLFDTVSAFSLHIETSLSNSIATTSCSNCRCLYSSPPPTNPHPPFINTPGRQSSTQLSQFVDSRAPKIKERPITILAACYAISWSASPQQQWKCLTISVKRDRETPHHNCSYSAAQIIRTSCQ